MNLSHRSACCEDVGDGAGILTSIPHEFFSSPQATTISLPERGNYGVGMIFFSKSEQIGVQKKKIEDTIVRTGLEVLCWRKVPVDESWYALLFLTVFDRPLQ